jgi:hypothetical protein
MAVMDEQVAELVRRAHGGEVLGVELFERRAGTRTDDDERRRLRAARDHEAATLAEAQRLADALGVATGDATAERELAARVAEAMAPLPWTELVEALVAGTAPYRDLYAQLAAACDHPAVDVLIAHEPRLHALLRET